jgi:hypothetical protein
MPLQVYNTNTYHVSDSVYHPAVLGDEQYLGINNAQLINVYDPDFVNGVPYYVPSYSMNPFSYPGYAQFRIEIDYIYWSAVWSGAEIVIFNGQEVVNRWSNDRVVKTGNVLASSIPVGQSVPVEALEPPAQLPQFGIWKPYLGGVIGYNPIVTNTISERVYGRPIITDEYYTGGESDITITTAYPSHQCPNYRDLVGGYALDNRTIPSRLKFTPTESKRIFIGYWRENKLENIQGLKTIYWCEKYYDVILGKETYINIDQCTLGTLRTSGSIVNLLSIDSPIQNQYSINDLFEQAIPTLFAHWNSLFAADNANPNNYSVFNDECRLHILAANNDYWHNRPIPTEDVNFDSQHPMYTVNNQQAYDWHIKPVDQGIGTLIMDSPRIVEIHAALNAPQYSFDPTTNQPIVVNLGHLISKIAELMGYRPLPDGKFTKEQEVSKLRQIVDKNTPVDKTKVGVNNFGSDGMILTRLNNSFSGDKVTADQCVLVHDIPQLLAEYQDQLNLALGLQESSAIEIKSATSTARYHNQLQLLIELLNLAKSNHAAINAALISGLVSQGQTSELIAALGLPTVTKTIPIQIDNQINHLPYAGIAPHRSISQEIATCTANVGIVLGQLI